MTTWKKFEREIASWFHTKRNPLSGTNNRFDDGTKAYGDVIYKPALVECKVRDGIASISRAKETAQEADKHDVPWVHIERAKGDRQRMLAVMPTWMMKEVVIPALRLYWEGEYETDGGSPKTPGRVPEPMDFLNDLLENVSESRQDD